MSNVIRLSGPAFRPHAIEIDGGVVKSTTLIGEGGSRPLTTGIGDYVFFVELIEESGARLGLWDGQDYFTAICEAEAARIGFGISEPVRDIVAGGRDL